MRFFSQSFAVIRKDLLIEWRTRERLTAMVFFAGLVVLLFHFAFQPGSPAMQAAAPGIFWIATVFAGLLGLSRSFGLEVQNDCLMGLRLSAADSGALYLGKMLSNALMMLVLQALIWPLLIVFLNIDLLPALPLLLLPMVLGTLGFAAVGTLFSAMSAHTRLQEALLPMLTLPVLVPALLAAVESFRAILSGAPWSEIASWLWLGGAFAGLFSAACLLLFDYVLED